MTSWPLAQRLIHVRQCRSGEVVVRIKVLGYTLVIRATVLVGSYSNWTGGLYVEIVLCPLLRSVHELHVLYAYQKY